MSRERSYEFDPHILVWKFKDVLVHQKVNPGGLTYKGSSYNLMILCEDGLQTHGYVEDAHVE